MPSLQTIPFKKMDGTHTSLADFAGKVVLVVNVASKCGLTPQYEGLERIHREYKDKGFTVLGFPANDFMGQEPGTNAEIEEFCKLTYDVSFPLAQKISVKGGTKHPLYAKLIELCPKATSLEGSSLRAKLEKAGELPDGPDGILWNFEKFLINQKGEVVARFAPDVPPEADIVKKKIEELLNRS